MLSENPKAFDIFKKVVDLTEIKILNNIFTTNGYELRMAGGPVRDILCGIQPNDIDFASNANPKQMINILRDKENIRLITTPSGERHGTITARINDKHQFEITSLRIDKMTDGRHAEVVFINDWKIDASRRDLTINSMFLDLNGVLYDYFSGETDLKNKFIRFVGEAEDRIREDYLRIFRYFRFHVRFGCASKHDLKTLNTIKANLDGIKQISGERIWSELKRIVVLKNCTDVINIMFNDIQIGKHLGFRADSNPNTIKVEDRPQTETFTRDLSEFKRVLSNLKSGVDSGIMTGWEPFTIFASLIKDANELLEVVKRLKLSNIERNSIQYIIINREIFPNITLNDLRKQLAIEPKPNQDHLRKSIIECMKYCGLFTQIKSFSEWEIPEFPFNGKLIAGKVKKRQLIKDIIDELKMFWINSEFKCTEDDLKLELENILLKDKYKS